ncbi:MAG: hypothetical protein WC141_09625 [Arcobacteraceae bacterium]
MNLKSKNLLLIGFLAAFFFIGFIAFKDAMPEDKNKRVYSVIKLYLPYTYERSLSGFNIVNKKTGEKEQPPASEALKYMDKLDKEWGKEFLKLDGNTLIILDDNKESLKQIEITPEEKAWVQSFFEIQ